MTASIRVRNISPELTGSLAKALGLREVVARCLLARGIDDVDRARAFLDPKLNGLRPPVGLAGMEAAAERVATSVEAGECIGVFGDYDVDGVTTAALLTTFLQSVGAKVVSRVASRVAGYGFGVAEAKALIEAGASFLITGDCGTSDLDALNYARSEGIDVVVVDHHTVPSDVAGHPAYALVNPFRDDSTFAFRGMASVGLSFYLAAAVRTALRGRGYFANREVPDLRELLDLVALGTVADMVPLTDENRVLTSAGLRVLAERRRPGIKALLEAAGVALGTAIDEKTIGFRLGPRLNAPGRLGDAAPALRLLTAEMDAARTVAEEIEALNTERRAIQDRMVVRALELAELQRDAAAIVVADPTWQSGVVGIVAAKLVDVYQRPVFAIAIDEVTGLGRGSARTVVGINLYDALAAAGDHLERFGGHAAAAGLTVRADRLAEVRRLICDAVIAQQEVMEGTVSGGDEVDAELSLDDLDERLCTELEQLAPFGQANPAPRFVGRRVRVVAARKVGDGSHLKLSFQTERGTEVGGIGFGLAAQAPAVGAQVDVVYVPKVSTFGGRRRVEVEVLALVVVD